MKSKIVQMTLHARRCKLLDFIQLYMKGSITNCVSFINTLRFFFFFFLISDSFTLTLFLFDHQCKVHGI